MSIWWPSSRVTIAFLMSERVIGLAPAALRLPFTTTVFTRLTLTLNRSGHSLGDGRLGRVKSNAEHDLVGFGSCGWPFR